MSLADALYRIGDGSGREGQEHLICITGLGPLYDAYVSLLFTVTLRNICKFYKYDISLKLFEQQNLALVYLYTSGVVSISRNFLAVSRKDSAKEKKLHGKM